LRVSASARLFRHAAKGVIADANRVGLAGVNREGMAVGVPSKSMKRVVRGISVVVVSRGCAADAGDAVDGVGICGLKAVRTTRFIYVSEGIVRKRLRRCSAAICGRYARDIIINVGTVLRACAVEAV
jgi:hypothetical protein